MTALLERVQHRPGEIDRPTSAGFLCTVGEGGRRATRHAGLFVPDHNGAPLLIPACGIGVSARDERRVLPYLFGNVVTCQRSGCLAHASPDQPVFPRGEQLMLDLPLPH